MAEFIERAKFTCALGGALTTIAGINRAVPIVHAAGGCAAALSGTYNLAAGYRGTGYCGGTMIPTTNISENNIVFGGEERLEEQIENSIEILDADLYIVITGCQVEIIGDDAVGVARRFRDRNVIGASTPGFLGNTFKGYDAILKALIKDVIVPSEKKDVRTINILGTVPGHDVFYRGNLDEIKRLLGLLGIKVNTFFGTVESVADIKGYGKAGLTVLLSNQAGVEPAELLRELHDIPYIKADLPIGPSGTEAFLYQVGEALGIEKEYIEAVAEKEKQHYYSYLERIVDIYSDIDFQRYVVIAADSYYAYPLTGFLANDLGWIPFLTSINDITEEEEQENYRKKFEHLTSETRPKVLFRQNAGELLKEVKDSWPNNHNQKYYDAFGPAFVVGSSIERGLAEKLGANFLSVAFPVSNRVVLNKSYAGFRGALTLIEDLISDLVAAR
ncbi:nitrogenase molybdenum-iron protein beta chain [Anaerocolumna jejuensis DSM 15929]|uniref:Nitrogenase molybdenum-iron protein beta chain n=1 Tax=Anaerocolumna jejuensis DSM 15929 TaxID=1121322 RepID=A0A1M6JYF9_9FIRM|nr:nitrogenase component 1 [Anaerocolumna jejuensis]SHJ51715.1 nitrogenase molybdenum-iron protein beta chain [Anaerocolumna jejuensis DSM 15929]